MAVNMNPVSAIADTELAAAAGTRVFFGHQSVGGNVLDGVADVYAARGLPAPDLVEAGDASGVAARSSEGRGGLWSHAYLGQNGDPFGKIEDFDARIRGGVGREVDVAFMKLCYVDVTHSTDVDALFTRYRETMAALGRDFPDVEFLHVTTPLTTEADLPSRLKSMVKGLLGRDGVEGSADNAARERFNSMMRDEYDADRLFDLAGIESTLPDGTRASGSHDGQSWFALYDGYASDSGHLNEDASAMAAAHLLALVARSAK